MDAPGPAADFGMTHGRTRFLGCTTSEASWCRSNLIRLKRIALAGLSLPGNDTGVRQG